MRIVVLVDNAADTARPFLLCEHGLSLLIEHDDHRVLCDTGSSGAFLHNARCLGIDVATIDFALVSHGHDDHSGGLSAFFAACGSKAYIHANVAEERYFSSRKGRREISCDKGVLAANAGRIHYLTGSKELFPGVFAVQCQCRVHPVPHGNAFLTKISGEKEAPDDFSHELSLAIITDAGLVVVSPCSHRGALNIIDECMGETGCSELLAYVGGLHFVDGDGCECEASLFAEEFVRLYPDARLYTGHCTCDRAKMVLAANMANVRFSSTGMAIEL